MVVLDFVVVVVVQEYEEAQNCIDRVLQMEPTNYQAQQLKALITKKITRGTIQM